MSSFTLRNGFQSPLGYISNLIGNSIEKSLTRKLSDVRDNFVKTQLFESEHLEELNHYKEFSTDDLDSFENQIRAYSEIRDLLKTMGVLIDASKSELDNEDPLHTDLILLNNEIKCLSETLDKVTDKLNKIHTKLLVKSSESISSDILNDLWKDEEDLWDNFYLETQS